MYRPINYLIKCANIRGKRWGGLGHDAAASPLGPMTKLLKGTTFTRTMHRSLVTHSVYHYARASSAFAVVFLEVYVHEVYMPLSRNCVCGSR